jgi:hypothetical protein
MKEEIIEAIATYLKKETLVHGTEREPFISFEGLNAGHFTHAGFCLEVANEIFEKIRQLVAMSIISEVEIVPKREAKCRVVYSDGTVQYLKEKLVLPEVQEMNGGWILTGKVEPSKF